jgi:hypothetical protein
VEVYFYCDFDSHRMTVFHGGLELPGSDCFDGLFVETHAKAAQDADVAGTAIGSDNQAESTDTLVLRFASFFGKFRLGRINLARRRDAAAHMEDASTGAATFARTKTRSPARSNAAAAARTNATA